MTDLVERLRSLTASDNEYEIVYEAADEIERLRAAQPVLAVTMYGMKWDVPEIERLRTLKTPASRELLDITKGCLDSAEAEVERLRRELSYHAHTDEDIKIQNKEIERLRADNDALIVALKERLLASRCQCDDECALSIENERLRVQWRDSDPEKLFMENQGLRAEIEWLKTWKAEAIAWHEGQRAEIERLRARIKELETIFLPDRLTGGP